MRNSLSSPLMCASAEARRSPPYKLPLILLAKSPMRMHDRPPYAQNTEPFQWLDGDLRRRFYLAVSQSPCPLRRATPPIPFRHFATARNRAMRSWRASRDRMRVKQRLGGSEGERVERRSRCVRRCGRFALAVQGGCKFRADRSREEEGLSGNPVTFTGQGKRRERAVRQPKEKRAW